MPIVSLLAFRGLGGVKDEESPYRQEAALVRAGHVGFEGIIDNTIIGFSPSPDAVIDAGGEEHLLDLLIKYVPQSGCFQDDTEIFERAAQLATQGERTIVWQLEFELDDETLEKIKQWYTDKKEALYNFPDENGEFKENEFNCATIPKLFGIPLPKETGLIKEYVMAMRAQGATRWQKSKA